MNHKLKTTARASFLIALACLNVYGLPISSLMLSTSTDVVRQVGNISYPYQINANVTGTGNGGSFRFNQITNPAPYPTGGNTTAAEVDIWCVDSQNNAAGNYNASIFSLANIAANSNLVRYSTALFARNLSGSYDATTRYRMAAALIEKYSLSDEMPDGNNSTNKAIQRAIWSIMDTDTINNNLMGQDATAIGATNTEIEWAKANLVSLDAKWAVISGQLTGDGTGFSNLSATQTFLVKFTGNDLTVPEPGFYGALAVGLSALLFFKRQRSA